MTARIFIVCSGAGAGIQSEIWRTPGCSEYFAGAAFPYGADQLDDFLGFTPERACCADTALEMAMAAYARAWLPGREGAIGVALTAVVASAREHRGDHRLHGAVVTDQGAWSVDELLRKATGETARFNDGARADGLVYDLLYTARESLSGRGDWKLISADERTARARELFFDRPVFSELGERLPLDELGPGALFPGAFNPPHAGHFGAANACGQAVTFAITADPPHKKPLTLAELLQRAKLLRGHRRLFTQGDALYIDKARRFPGRPLVIGADALLRMLDPQWGPEPLPMVCEFSELGTTLLVVGREIDDRFMTAHNVLDAAGVPPDLRDGFRDVPGQWDLSSTELRAAG